MVEKALFLQSLVAFGEKNINEFFEILDHSENLSIIPSFFIQLLDYFDSQGERSGI
jgi:hypothetical protein